MIALDPSARRGLAPRVAFLCPGQGAQKIGMGRALAEAFPEARAAFDEAAAALGEAFVHLLWEGPEDELTLTHNAQPALLAHAVAAQRVLDARGVRPVLAAGHSLGEYAAHVAAGSLAYADALRLVRRRGELMLDAGRRRPGAMAAILGLEASAVEAGCRAVRESGGGDVVAANLNSPSQVVISGEVDAVEAAMKRLKEAGARRAVRLEVSGAFHSPLMASAADGLREALGQVAIRDVAFPVVANATARPVQHAGEIRDTLAAQLLAPVRWEESMRWLLSQSVTAFVEVGSGTVLRGLLRGLDPSALSANVDDPRSLEETLAALAGARAESRS
jgi:[acyl-carrier-protein] S-malonyltransferase